MRKKCRVREQYPLFYAYGDRQEFLSPEEAADATTEERIRSIWPFLVDRVLKFAATLRPREQANNDPEDILSDLWITLAEKDSQWNPEKGKYITYAATIIDRRLCSIRDQSRTVQSPRNSAGRMREYLAEESIGLISSRRRKTADDIRRTSTAIVEIDSGNATEFFDPHGDSENSGPVADLIGVESNAGNLRMIRSAFRNLDEIEAFILNRVAGLRGGSPQTLVEIAKTIRRDPAEIRKIKIAALAKIRKHLAGSV